MRMNQTQSIQTLWVTTIPRTTRQHIDFDRNRLHYRSTKIHTSPHRSGIQQYPGDSQKTDKVSILYTILKNSNSNRLCLCFYRNSLHIAQNAKGNHIRQRQTLHIAILVIVNRPVRNKTQAVNSISPID